MNKKVIGVSFLLSIFLLSSFGASAQTTAGATGDMQITPVSVMVDDVDPSQTSTCLDLKSGNLRYRVTDANTNGEVSDLQDFLVATSFLKTQATGFFGLGTFSAVKQFQKSAGINPTGFVGPLTKAKIKEQSCNGLQSGGTSTTDGQEINPQNTYNPKKGNSTQLPPLKTGKIMGLPPTSVDGVTEINPLNTYNPKTGFGSTTSPKRCTMEARLCLDGKMMARNPVTCEWVPSSCIIEPVFSCIMEYRACPNGAPMPYDSNCKYLPEKCTVVIPPKSTSTPPKMCTTEARLCLDGRMMARNPYTCEWIPSSCVMPTPTQPAGVPKIAPTPPTPVDEVTEINPLNTYNPKTGTSSYPRMCTAVMRLCPNGSAMPRDTACGWHPELCTGGTGGSQLLQAF